MKYDQLSQQCEQFSKLAQEFKAPKVPFRDPYQSGERPLIKFLPEVEHPKAPSQTIEVKHPKHKGMIISKEQALEEVANNGLDPLKFVAEMGDADFYKAREVLSWVMSQE
jgi:hypothetical protein